MKTFVYIDESGDAGLERIRTDATRGASPYFVIAAAVLPKATRIAASNTLERFSDQIPKKKWAHATDLDHSSKVYLCRELARLNLRFFAVISNKVTLGDYADQIRRDPHFFYNKCAKYLLERVCAYLSSKGLSQESPEVIFEARNHDYDAMRRYLGKVKDKPLHPESRSLSILNPFAISTRTKAEESLLKIADMASHAVYQCANKSDSNWGIPEPRYLSELSSRFGADEKGRVEGIGIKCIHSLNQLQLDSDIAHFLSALRAYPMKVVPVD